MIDAITVVTVAAGITRTALECGKGVHSFFSGNVTINNDIHMLHSECTTLHNNSEGLKRIMSRPEVEQFHDPEIWDEAYEALDRCNKPLKELEATLKDLRASMTKHWTPRDAIRVIQKNLKEGDINRLRSQLQTHNMVLTGVQNRIVLFVSAKGFSQASQTFREILDEIKKLSKQDRAVTQPEVLEWLEQRFGARLSGETQGVKPPKPLVEKQVHEPTWLAHKKVASKQHEKWAKDLSWPKDQITDILETTFIPLHWAVMANAPDEAKSLLKHLPSLTGSSDGRRTFDYVNERSEHQSDLNRGWTAMHAAAYKSDVTMVAWLLAKGASVDARSKSGYTPLYIAARTGRDDMMDCLIAAGADKSIALLECCNRGDELSDVRRMLDHGAAANSAALAAAAFGNSRDIVRVLVQHGADIIEAIAELHKDSVRRQRLKDWITVSVKP